MSRPCTAIKSHLALLSASPHGEQRPQSKATSRCCALPDPQPQLVVVLAAAASAVPAAARAAARAGVDVRRPNLPQPAAATADPVLPARWPCAYG